MIQASADDVRPAVTRPHVWLALAFLTALPLVFALTREMWESPLPIDETVAVLEVSGVLSDTGAAHAPPGSDLAAFFDPYARSWYRPLFFTTWAVFWHATHSVETTLLLIKVLEIGTVAAIIGGFLLVLGPRSPIEFAAATAALGVLAGSSGFRENLELPMLMTLVGMPVALAVWAILERPHRWWHGPALVLLAAIAVGFKEQGLVLVPIIVAAWWVRAPGVRFGTAAAVTLLTAAYLAMRFATSGTWAAFEQDIALGFESIPAAEAVERFGAFPYWIYLYSAAATAGNILFAEPRDGAFGFVHGLVNGSLSLRTATQVLTSTATTALLAWWAVRTWRREPAGTWSADSRLVVALVLAVGASAALGFSYPRERLAGMAVVFYALAAYPAFRALASWMAAQDSRRARGAAAALVLLAAAWQVRTIDTVATVHGWSRQARREWIVDRLEAYREHAGQDAYLRIFRALEPQGVAPRRGHVYPFAGWAETPVWPGGE